jgi:hypothetical protein
MSYLIKDEYPSWVKNALNRMNTRERTFVVDTQELAEEYGVRIGTTIIEKVPPPLNTNTQEVIDEFMAHEFLMNNL